MLWYGLLPVGHIPIKCVLPKYKQFLLRRNCGKLLLFLLCLLNCTYSSCFIPFSFLLLLPLVLVLPSSSSYSHTILLPHQLFLLKFLILSSGVCMFFLHSLFLFYLPWILFFYQVYSNIRRNSWEIILLVQLRWVF